MSGSLHPVTLCYTVMENRMGLLWALQFLPLPCKAVLYIELEFSFWALNVPGWELQLVYLRNCPLAEAQTCKKLFPVLQTKNYLPYFYWILLVIFLPTILNVTSANMYDPASCCLARCLLTAYLMSQKSQRKKHISLVILVLQVIFWNNFW